MAHRTRHPTPQGPQSAGPGNRHGAPPDDTPDDTPDGTPDGRARAAPDRTPPEPAQDPEAMARRVLDQARKAPR